MARLFLTRVCGRVLWCRITTGGAVVKIRQFLRGMNHSKDEGKCGSFTGHPSSTIARHCHNSVIASHGRVASHEPQIATTAVLAGALKISRQLPQSKFSWQSPHAYPPHRPHESSSQHLEHVRASHSWHHTASRLFGHTILSQQQQHMMSASSQAVPSGAPSPALTKVPLPALTKAPSPAPIEAPSPAPIEAPSPAPIEAPSPAPIEGPSPARIK